LIHNLIFLPFLIRFWWGIISLLGSLNNSETDWIWAMIDKNNPVTAFLFDLTGAMVLAGAIAALGRHLIGRRIKSTLSGLPKPDWLALGLILGIVVVGFVTEAMRISMTGAPAGSGWAFLGRSLSHLFKAGPGLSLAYGYVWYIHAILTGAFIAYLPFSRMFHIILAPVVLTAGAARAEDRKG
jgi:nitrate reductase gamma subunit